MLVDLITVSYDSGHRGVRMGGGPERLLDAGLADGLERDGHQVRVTDVVSAVDPPTEVAVAFDLARSLAATVRAAREDGGFPLVLAGNCFSAVGTVAGLGPESTAVLWLDAHADLNTPDTTTSGFLDGMAASTLTGRCWRQLAAGVPGFAPIPDVRFALVGARDFDPAEVTLVATARIGHVSADAFRRHGADAALAPILAGARPGIDGYYLHIDLDVLDPGVGRANRFAAPDGLAVEDVVDTARAAGRIGVAGAALTAFDPDLDDQGRIADAATRIARALAGSPAPAL